MTIQIEDVWLGDLFEGKRDVLILSRVKDPRDHPEGVKALNWYRSGMKPRRFLPVDAGEGSKLVYYSAAVDARELDVSIKIATDHAFDPEVAKKWVQTATGVAGLPAFLGAGPQGQAIVTAAGAALEIGVDLIDNLLDGEPVNLGWQMNIEATREGNFRGGWVLLTPDYINVEVSEFLWWKESAEVELEIDGEDYVVDENGKLLWRDTRKRVEEDWPYALLKVDGTRDDDLKKWKAMELTAELTTRFLSADRGPLHTDVTDAFAAFNDVRLTQEIAALDKKLGAKGLTAAKKKELKEEKQSAIDNLQDDSLRTLLLPKEKAAK
ncbi:hypothetical protein [Mycetocola miduiensis]|uniref:Uncharacterized protein n=1 Tax=Mycetocola miduiensis TaxID=995034 RepID=A0A1I4YC25_9MICO|nr:hypothetical protein [Mycetocola miduiensis]SFN35595.1 hypothetical protein SAMN05216219_0110 [Mycetocola miduiensis]